jgi:competence protein ComEC
MESFRGDFMLKKYLLALMTMLTFLVVSGCTEATNENNTTKNAEEISQETQESAYPAVLENNQEKEQKKDELSKSASENEMKVHYIDVGQGDSTLIQYSEDGEEYTILIDAGNFNSINVISYLQSQNIDQIDIAIGTHPDADHIGQLDQVVNTFDVEEVWLSGNTSTSQTFQELLAAIDAKGVGYHEPRMGEEYEIGSLVVDVLYPKSITGESNAESISLKMTYGDVRFVFTGDAEQENEVEMVNSGADLKAEILHLGHHGSNTSTHPTFLNEVHPEVAIYSAGEDNSYGHPHPEVVNLIEHSGIQLYGTDVNGTIIVTTDGKDYDIETKEEGTISPSSLEEGLAEKVPTHHPADSESNPLTNPSANKGRCIDINKASIEQLQEIVHIGPERAQDVVNLRPYQSVEDLSRIEGIGPSRLNDIVIEGLACVRGG